MNRPIALQLYSVRNDAQANLHNVLEQVAQMGYDGVEFAGYYGNDTKEIRKWLDGYGLKAEGCHIGIDALSSENFQRTVDDHKNLGSAWAIIAWLPEEMRSSPQACAETGKRLTELSHKLEGQNMRLGFHAHHADMLPLDGGKPAWHLIAEGTPKSFIMQYDTANGMSGGADPVQPILDLPGRGASTHLKEWNGAHGAVIGKGEIPWQKVLQACETVGGTEWYVVEYEVDNDPSPLKSVDECLKFLKSL